MPYFLENSLDALAKASWEGSVLILLVLLIQVTLGRKVNPKWRNGLWLLVMVRLAMPPTISSRVSLFNYLDFRMGPTASAARTAVARHSLASANDSVRTDPQPEATKTRNLPLPLWGRHGSSVRAWLLGIWSAGALTFATCLLATHWRLSRKVAKRPALTDTAVLNLVEECKKRMNLQEAITLVETSQVSSPSLFGFLRPRLLLPVGMTRSFSLDELRFVFLHELGHIKRRDILVGWLAAALQIVHWFNPLVWLAFYRMRADREMACDALALSSASEGENRRYGDTIIKLLESFGKSAWAPSLAGAVENRNQLEERIRMIAAFKKNNRGVALAALLFAGLGLITLTDAQPAPSDDVKNIIGTWIWVGTPGQVGDPAAAGGRYKVITEKTWEVNQADPRTGSRMFHHGGTYTLKGNDYAETVNYTDASSSEINKQTFKFNVKVEGDTLTLMGIGNPWQEIWKRVKSDSAKPRKADSSAIQGKWRGKENGVQGTSSCVLTSSTLEYHGADTNEWYKADISVYDTMPKQIVVVVTDCPFPQYVGRTSYAIYKLEDGTLTISGNEPGFPGAPTAFEAAGSRTMVFKK